MQDFCVRCNDSVPVTEERKPWGCEWRCVVCGAVTDQDFDEPEYEVAD